MDNLIGKKIMAYDNIIDFRTNEIVGRSRGVNCGVIEEINEEKVKVFDKSNPIGYQNYELKRKDFDKWVQEKTYVLK